MAEAASSAEGQQTPAQPVPGSEEYNQQMAAKAQAAKADPPVPADQQTPTADITPMPEGGAEKFYNAETGEYNWQAHAKEAEYRLSQGSTPNKEDGQAGEDGTPPANAEPTPFSEAGLTHEAITKELDEAGKLSDETREGLKKLGVPDDTVAWIEQAHADQKRAAESEGQAAIKEAYEIAGGKDSWESMEQWAVKNLTGEEIVELNERLNGPNWKNAIGDLKARYTQAEGSGPKDLHAGTGRSGTPAGYTSRAEMKADMASPKYQSDPAFRAEVAQKMRHATWSHDQ